MNRFDLNSLPEKAHIHFIAIGGISMSGLAQILMGQGFRISGSDSNKTHITDRLSQMGATVYIGQSADNIKDPDLVVYSAAIKPDNPEFMAAEQKNIPIIDRATLLGAIMKSYRFPVAVAGTHGKTTTTCMLAHIFLAAQLDPTVSVGGELPAIGGNIRVGQSDYFVCEACEYHRSFLRFFPFVNIILNIEADHLDYFKDLDDIINTFNSLALLTPEDGAVAVNYDDENVRKAILGVDRQIITCSMREDADYTAKNIVCDSLGFAQFDVYEKGTLLGTVKLGVAGMHNVSNALCAIASARYLSVDFEGIQKGLADFCGVNRRFEFKGERDGIRVIDDYAHHPTEINATLSTAVSATEGKVWCVFQPHTYTRTYTLFDDFVSALSCDITPLILDIYAAREKDTGLVSSGQLAAAIDGAIYIDSFDSCVDYLRKNAKAGDLVLTMGAGDVFKVGEAFLND